MFRFTFAQAKFALRVTFLVNSVVPELTQQEPTEIGRSGEHQGEECDSRQQE